MLITGPGAGSRAAEHDLLGYLGTGAHGRRVADVTARARAVGRRADEPVALGWDYVALTLRRN